MTYGNGLTLTQGYDNQYRISSIVTGSILNLAFGYDPNGNIISILDTVNPPGGEVLEMPGTYSYQQATNKLTHIEATPPIDFGYDANGNITSSNNRTFIYDLSNQLLLVDENGTTIAEYVYNGIGQRIKKNAQGSVRVFHYNQLGYLISETTDTGQTLVEYIYIGSSLLAKIQGEQVYYYHNDHLGTPQILTDDSGSIVWKASYTPFGEAQVVIETVTNPFRLVGQYSDQETGLHYNYFRYYDPKAGRYITPDPSGLEGGINLFAFAEANPGTWSDFFGLTPQDRVRWVIAQYSTNRNAWKGSLLGKRNVCNEFVAAAHVLGDPDVLDYPTVLRNNEYSVPTVADLADPSFAPSRLEYLPIAQVQPGDIIIWYGGGTHHSAIYIGNNQVIYQIAGVGLKMNTIQGTTAGLGFGGKPIVRRYRY